MVGLGVVTDVNGNYSVVISSGWDGVVTPTKAGYTFDPNSRTYTDVTADQANQNYEALPLDNFSDNRRGIMWRYIVEGDDKNAWLTEGASRLNLRASDIVYLPSSCVGYWAMDDNQVSTTVADSTSNGKDGTARRNTSVLHTTGKVGGALSFNGTSDYVDLGNVIARAAYTKVAWVKRDDANSYNNIVSSGDATSHALYAPYNRQFRLCAGHTGDYYDTVKDTQPLAAGVWYQVAVTYDPTVSSGKMVLYKNGVEVNEASNVPLPGAGSTKTVIGRFTSSYYMQGAIDNVMIFNRALAADEIGALYAQDTASDINLTASCVGHWKMNDYAATMAVLDSSGNDNNGTSRQNTSVLHTTGKIDGALTFNGSSDYVNIGNVIPRAAYTKVAWVNRNDVSTAYNNIVSSGDATSHALYAPYNRQFRLCAGHTGDYYDTVKDTQPLAAGVWYFVAVTYDPNVSSGKMVLYKNGVEVNEASNVPLPGAGSTQTCIGKFSTNYYMNGAIDNVMIFNRALTADEIAALYNKSNGTETIPSGSSSVVGTHQATYLPNGWSLDVDRDLAVKVDYHYGQTSAAEGWAGLSVGDDSNYVSISAGSDANASYFYYEAVVDGSSASEKLPRTSNDGTLYITYDATDRKFYLSHTGFGSEYADVWQTTNPTQGLWAMPLDVSMGGGSSGACLYSGEAFLDNFEMNSAGLFDWPPKNDVNGDGFIDYYDLRIICENWLDDGPGDLDNSNTVDFGDLAKMGLAW
jgi:hypothetical protein